ncbi:hypothetical protein CEN39_16895 [Fischerella thermalis CCMEE 5201]|nr:hypothetical protein CEN39_16895 [Fischerella thermalis CCMEE 5201]
MEVCTKGTKDYCIDFLSRSRQPILDFGFWIDSTDFSGGLYHQGIKSGIWSSELYYPLGLVMGHW